MQPAQPGRSHHVIGPHFNFRSEFRVWRLNLCFSSRLQKSLLVGFFFSPHRHTLTNTWATTMHACLRGAFRHSQTIQLSDRSMGPLIARHQLFHWRTSFMRGREHARRASLCTRLPEPPGSAWGDVSLRTPNISRIVCSRISYCQTTCPRVVFLFR